MRVLCLASTFHPVIGGAETYILNLARGLDAIGHRVQIITDSVANQPERECVSKGVGVRRLSQYRHTFNAPDRILWEQMQFGLCDEIADEVEQFAPDVVFSNSLDVCVQGKLVSLHTGKPWIATFHEQSPERESFGEARLQLAYALLKPDAIVAGSQLYLARGRRFGGVDRTHLIYHGIDTNQFHDMESSSSVRSHYGVPENHFLIVSAGRFKPRKGFTNLIQATRVLKNLGRQVTVIIAGSLNSASVAHWSELRALVQLLSLEQNIIFEEKITHERMPWLLSGGDLVVQASLEEGLPLAVIEAMACSRPLVATRISGVVDIVKGDAMATLVEPNTSDSLAAAIDDLLGDEQRRRAMGLLARAHVVEHFSLERMVAATAELMEEILRNGSLNVAK
ncbi:MAG: glycosyltransferase family 4 protein [Micropepsaceae bacterium]